MSASDFDPQSLRKYIRDLRERVRSWKLQEEHQLWYELRMEIHTAIHKFAVLRDRIWSLLLFSHDPDKLGEPINNRDDPEVIFDTIFDLVDKMEMRPIVREILSQLGGPVSQFKDELINVTNMIASAINHMISAIKQPQVVMVDQKADAAHEQKADADAAKQDTTICRGDLLTFWAVYCWGTHYELLSKANPFDNINMMALDIWDLVAKIEDPKRLTFLSGAVGRLISAMKKFAIAEIKFTAMMSTYNNDHEILKIYDKMIHNLYLAMKIADDKGIEDETEAISTMAVFESVGPIIDFAKGDIKTILDENEAKIKKMIAAMKANGATDPEFNEMIAISLADAKDDAADNIWHINRIESNIRMFLGDKINMIRYTAKAKINTVLEENKATIDAMKEALEKDSPDFITINTMFQTILADAKATVAVEIAEGLITQREIEAKIEAKIEA